MLTFLVIHFNRYNTEQSTHSTVGADSPTEALITVLTAEYGGDYEDDDLEEMAVSTEADLMLVNEEFSCMSGEEDDWLVYLVK